MPLRPKFDFNKSMMFILEALKPENTFVPITEVLKLGDIKSDERATLFKFMEEKHFIEVIGQQIAGYTGPSLRIRITEKGRTYSSTDQLDRQDDILTEEVKALVTVPIPPKKASSGSTDPQSRKQPDRL
ncbi:hypothetical protein ES705_49317 [subsurface metagenome]